MKPQDTIRCALDVLLRASDLSGLPRSTREDLREAKDYLKDRSIVIINNDGGATEQVFEMFKETYEEVQYNIIGFDACAFVKALHKEQARFVVQRIRTFAYFEHGDTLLEISHKKDNVPVFAPRTSSRRIFGNKKPFT